MLSLVLARIYPHFFLRMYCAWYFHIDPTVAFKVKDMHFFQGSNGSPRNDPSLEHALRVLGLSSCPLEVTNTFELFLPLTDAAGGSQHPRAIKKTS